MKTVFIYFFSLFMILSAAYAQGQKATRDTLIPLNNQSNSIKAAIAGKSGGEIAKEELLNPKGLETTDSAFHVMSYKMSLIGKNVEYREFSGRDNNLSDDMRAAIKQIPSGTKVFFEYIKTETKNKESRMLTPLSFIIK